MALGRTKIGRRQRAEVPASQPEAAEPDHELESYLAALTPEESVETTGSGRRFGASQVYQLRLPLMANEQLKELAVRQGTSPGALARDWIMQHLQAEAPSPQASSAPAPAWPQEAPAEQPQPYADQNPYGGDPYGAPGQAPQQYGYTPNYGDETDTEITMPRRQGYYG